MNNKLKKNKRKACSFILNLLLTRVRQREMFVGTKQFVCFDEPYCLHIIFIDDEAEKIKQQQLEQQAQEQKKKGMSTCFYHF